MRKQEIRLTDTRKLIIQQTSKGVYLYTERKTDTGWVHEDRIMTTSYTSAKKMAEGLLAMFYSPRPEKRNIDKGDGVVRTLSVIKGGKDNPPAAA